MREGSVKRRVIVGSRGLYALHHLYRLTNDLVAVKGAVLYPLIERANHLLPWNLQADILLRNDTRSRMRKYEDDLNVFKLLN